MYWVDNFCVILTRHTPLKTQMQKKYFVVEIICHCPKNVNNFPLVVVNKLLKNLHFWLSSGFKIDLVLRILMNLKPVGWKLDGGQIKPLQPSVCNGCSLPQIKKQALCLYCCKLSQTPTTPWLAGQQVPFNSSFIIARWSKRKHGH